MEDRTLLKARVDRAKNKLPSRRTAEDWFYYNMYMKQLEDYIKKLKKEEKDENGKE